MLFPFARFLLVLLTLVGSSDSAFVAPSRSVHTKTTTTAAAWGSHTNNVTPQRHSAQRNENALVMMAGAGLLEKKEGGPAVLDRPEISRKAQTQDPAKERKDLGSEAWEVRIYNDGMNTREHVARALVQVTGMSEMGAYQTMMQAHQNGIAVVGRWVYEVAEMYHDALKKNGIVCDLVPVEEE
jgi:ATP-dependent Clp protease adaptor protein ClpS